MGNVVGFGDGFLGGFGVVQMAEMPGVVQQAVGQVVGGAQLAQASDRRGEGRRGGRVAVAGGQAGADEVTFGPRHGC